MTVEVGVIISILSVIIAFLGYSLNRNKSIKADGQESAELKAELGHIRRGVDDIRIDLRANEKERIALGERVTRVEESTKQAHLRIDGIKKESV